MDEAHHRAWKRSFRHSCTPKVKILGALVDLEDLLSYGDPHIEHGANFLRTCPSTRSVKPLVDGKTTRHLSISPDRVVCHDREEVVPGVDGVQPAPLPPPVVGGDPVLPTALDVQRDQVHSKPCSGFWGKVERNSVKLWIVVSGSPWNRWLVTSCDTESSKAWET